MKTGKANKINYLWEKMEEKMWHYKECVWGTLFKTTKRTVGVIISHLTDLKSVKHIIVVVIINQKASMIDSLISIKTNRKKKKIEH